MVHLNFKNYKQWVDKMSGMFDLLDLSNHIQSKENSEIDKTSEQWITTENQVMKFILELVEDENLKRSISHIKTAAEIWEKLKSICEEKSSFDLLLLLENFKIDFNENLQTSLSELELIMEQITPYKFYNNESNYRATKLLNSLPEPYKDIRLKLIREGDLNYEGIKAKLLNYECELKSNGQKRETETIQKSDDETNKPVNEIDNINKQTDEIVDKIDKQTNGEIQKQTDKADDKNENEIDEIDDKVYMETDETDKINIQTDEIDDKADVKQDEIDEKAKDVNANEKSVENGEMQTIENEIVIRKEVVEETVLKTVKTVSSKLDISDLPELNEDQESFNDTDKLYKDKPMIIDSSKISILDQQQHNQKIQDVRYISKEELATVEQARQDAEKKYTALEDKKGKRGQSNRREGSADRHKSDRRNEHRSGLNRSGERRGDSYDRKYDRSKRNLSGSRKECKDSKFDERKSLDNYGGSKSNLNTLDEDHSPKDIENINTNLPIFRKLQESSTMDACDKILVNLWK